MHAYELLCIIIKHKFNLYLTNTIIYFRFREFFIHNRLNLS